MDIFDSSPLGPLLKEAPQRMYPKGQILVYQGDSPPSMFVLRSGEVKMYDIDEQGNEKILHILRPPAIFPIVGYLGFQSEVMWFYAALTEVDTSAIAYDRLVSQIQNNNELSLYLLSMVVTDIHELFTRIASMSKTKTRPKLIAALKFLALHHAVPHKKKKCWRRVTFKVNHQLLADMTGVTRESASVVMRQFQEEQVTRSPRLGILDINFDKLRGFE